MISSVPASRQAMLIASFRPDLRLRDQHRSVWEGVWKGEHLRSVAIGRPGDELSEKHMCGVTEGWLAKWVRLTDDPIRTSTHLQA